MKTKIIPISENKAIKLNARGEEQLIELKVVESKFYNKVPVKERLSLKGVISLLGSNDNEIEEAGALINVIDGFLSDRFISGVYLEEDEEAKDEIRKVLRMLDILKSKLDTIQRLNSVSINSLLDLN